jgi:hypothetical protein
VSKRRNRELAERWEAYRLSRDPNYIAGALASDVPADINPALAPVGRNAERRDPQGKGARDD